MGKNYSENLRKCPQKITLPVCSLLFSPDIQFAKIVNKLAILTHIRDSPHHNNIFTIDPHRNIVGARIYSRYFSTVIFDFYYC
jgi:hypothetical protein